MHPQPVVPAIPSSMLGRLLNGLSLFTLAMTIPQVVNVWVAKEAGAVSLLSWGAYLLSALVWVVYGLRKGDRHIWVPCIGWIALDAAIVVGIVVKG